jgi:hypothetical protein
MLRYRLSAAGVRLAGAEHQVVVELWTAGAHFLITRPVYELRRARAGAATALAVVHRLLSQL